MLNKIQKLLLFYIILWKSRKIVRSYRAQYCNVYYMKGGFNSIRNALESAASLAGNYFLPGSSLVTDQLVSKGSQGQLDSPLGEVAQVASGAAGSGIGSSVTGIPASAGGVAEGNLFNSASDYISQAINGTTANGATGLTNPDISPQFSIPGTTPAAAPTAGTGGAGAAGGDFGSSLNSDFGVNNVAPVAPAAGAGASAAGPAVPIPQGGFLSPATGNAINQAVGGAGSAAGVAAPSSGIMSTITNALKGTGSSLGTLGQVASLGGIAKNLLAPEPKGTNELLSAGSNALNTESQLINDEATGTLPPGQQATINQQVQDAQNTIRSKYASMGLSGSDQERQALQAASDQGVQLSTQAATQATQSGLTALGATNSIYSTILQSILGNNNNLSSSIATLSGVAQPKNNGGVNVTVGGINP